MPLHELYRMAKGKLDSREMINTSCAPDQSTAPENDFLELIWENGQISVQGQSSRGRKSPTTCKSLPTHCLQSQYTNNNSNNNNDMMRMGKFGDLDSGFNELRMPVPAGEEVGLTQDEDAVMPWLNYAMDEPLQNDYSAGLLHELSGVTMNDLPASNNFSLLDKRSNSNQVFRDSHRNYALKGSSPVAREVENPGHKAGTSQFYHTSSSHQYQASFSSVRSRVSDVTENNASNAAQHPPNCGEITQIFPSASSGFSTLKMMDKQDPIMSSSSSMTTIMNFSHFARPAAIVKANLQNFGLSSSKSENIVENKNKGAAAATASNLPESTKVDLSGDCPKELSAVHKKQVMEPSKADLKQLEIKSLEGNAIVSKQSDPTRKEDVSKTEQNSNLLHCESSNKGQDLVEKNVEPAVASSSVCSGNGAGRGSDDPNQNLKRKRRDPEDSEWHSEDVEEVSAGVKKAAQARGGAGFKRSRSAEVHNLSERRRRDRINEKMRALQELIPNCNKVDKASMLDEAIEYLKTLQLQVQIMSMGAGYYMPPMMLHAGMQHMHPPHMASFSPMGVGMQMGLGMGYGMGMHDINGGSSRFPIMQVPHMQAPHLPVTSISGPPALHGMGSSNPQMFGIPGQRLKTPMQRAPIFSLPGEPGMNSSVIGLNASGTAGVMENANLASASCLKDPTPNANSQAMQNTNACNSTNQMTTQSEATAGRFEHSDPSKANDGGDEVELLMPPKKIIDNLVIDKSSEL